MAELNALYESNDNILSYGGLGFDELENTDTQTAGVQFYMIEAQEDSVLTFTNQLDGQTHTSFSLLNSKRIYGVFDGLTMVSGRVIGYKIKT